MLQNYFSSFILLKKSILLLNFIQIYIGGYDNCPLGPFQLIPYNKGKLAEKFSDIDNRRAMMKSCSLRNVLVKFPDNAAEMELQWLDESYVGLNVFNNELSFKVCK